MKKIVSIATVLLLLLSCVPIAQADVQQTVSDQNGIGYGSLAEAISAADAGTVLTLRASSAESVSIDCNVTIDLNGFSVSGQVTVYEGCVLTVKDSQTDDYTVEDDAGYGKLSLVTGSVVAAEGYLMIQEETGKSFHKVDAVLTSVTLRPEVAGIYYNGSFAGDEVVAANVDAYGIALRLDKMPDAAYMKVSSACSRYYDFAAGEDGNTASGTLLNNVMRKGRTTAENKSNSQRKIYGAPYMRTTDGRYYFATGVSYSLMQVTQEADKQWSKLTQAQKDAVKKMYNSYESIVGAWYLPNINDTDIDIPI